MSETMHTPLPWKVVAAGVGVRASVSQLYKLETPLVGKTLGELLEEHGANAALFQEAVNSFERLEADSKKLREPATCNAGHKSNLPLALWDCPVCTQLLRDELDRLRLKVKELVEFLFYSTGQWDDENHRPAIPGTKNLAPTPEMLEILVQRAREVEAALGKEQ